MAPVIAEVRAILGLPDEVFTFALMPIGYPLDAPGPLSRRPVAQETVDEQWGLPWTGDLTTPADVGGA
ncbi:MAG: hypothetical protein AB7F35_20925 [Acetobacteraceae bacterium]